MNTLSYHGQRLSIEDVCSIARLDQDFRLSDAPDFVSSINKSFEFLDNHLKRDNVIYGVTTGFGDSCTINIEANQINQLSSSLYRFHGCGLGKFFSPLQARAILITRLVSLAQGYSGIRYELLDKIAELLSKNILPVIPEEGSVGASGDLTPLSYLAAVLEGGRQVWFEDRIRDTQQVYSKLGITPLQLKPKETLAIMNGTSVMTALACLAFTKANYLSRLSCRVTSLVSIAMLGNQYHFQKRLFDLKPHPGQSLAAQRIFDDLQGTWANQHQVRLQDRYSIRCAPHVIGVLEDALSMFRPVIETELNSTNDNPVIDASSQAIMHGGHFYGGHIAFVMDALKTAVANLADLLDRQLAQIVDVKFNYGLSANLANESMVNHGFKAVQISVSAWSAEALKQTMPASVFSRSTECHNQDKVSMGTIAARDCLRVIELTEQVVAAMLLATSQAVYLRAKVDDLNESELARPVCDFLKEFREKYPLLTEDRELEQEMRQLITEIDRQSWALYEY